MSHNHNFQKLKEKILPLSQAKSFYKAKLEWKLTSVHIENNWSHCPCGQKIKELCYITNVKNKNKIYVGNVCINNFMEIDTGNIFDGLRKIIKNINANPNKDLINYANKKGFLYGENEYKFLISLKGKSKLSDKQKSWRKKINRRIINETKVKK